LEELMGSVRETGEGERNVEASLRGECGEAEVTCDFLLVVLGVSGSSMNGLVLAVGGIAKGFVEEAGCFCGLGLLIGVVTEAKGLVDAVAVVLVGVGLRIGCEGTSSANGFVEGVVVGE
jgi:hypothetical protein